MTTPIRMVSVPVALPLKLLDTLKPLAVVAEKLKHCHVVEVCEPTPDNPSRNIIHMPREWFERTADDLEAIAILMHGAGVLSEGQAASLTGLDRVEVRKQVDAMLTAAPMREEGGAVPKSIAAVVDHFAMARPKDLAFSISRYCAPPLFVNVGDLRSLVALATREEAPSGTGPERALQDAVDFGVGYLVDGERVSPDRVTVCRGEEAPAEAGEDAEAIVRRWANWIIDESSDMDHDDHDAGKRKVRAERDFILRALRAQPQARSGERQ